MSNQPDPIDSFRTVAAIFGTYANEHRPMAEAVESPDFLMAAKLHRMAASIADMTSRRGNPPAYVGRIKWATETVADLRPGPGGWPHDLVARFPDAIKVLAEADRLPDQYLRSTMVHGSDGIVGRLRDYLNALSATMRDNSLTEVLRVSGSRLVDDVCKTARDMDPLLFTIRDLLTELRETRLVTELRETRRAMAARVDG